MIGAMTHVLLGVHKSPDEEHVQPTFSFADVILTDVGLEEEL